MKITTINFIQEQLIYLKESDHDCRQPYDACRYCSQVDDALGELEEEVERLLAL